MFDFKESRTPPVKAFITVGELPNYMDPGQTPRTKKPFSIILQQIFTHTVNLLMPEELFDIVWNRIETISNVPYSRVNMSLSDLIEKDFLNSYIKSGSIQMLSQGRPGLDNLFWLKDGILHLELPKSLYERAGLQGKPIRDGGRKHIKTRFAVDLNLRLPPMVHGKKGFERIKWAFRNVLHHTVTWLFLDLDAGGKKAGEGEEEDGSRRPPAEPDALEKHHPVVERARFAKTAMTCVRTPDVSPALCSSLSPSSTTISEEDICDLQEWLDLAGMDSPRIRSNDSIDSYLCRYDVPGGKEASTKRELVRLQWRGFLSPLWMRTLFAECLAATRKEERAWFALSGYAFPTEAVDGQGGYTVLRLSADDAVGTSEEEVGAETEESSGRRAKHNNAPPRYILWQMSNGYGGNV